MERVIVAGGREFEDYGLLKRELDELFPTHEITIVSGRARGADKLGEVYAKEYSLKVDLYPAEWDRLGKSAGYKRNEVMADNADTLVAFWNGESRGTKHMIDLATRVGLKVHVVRID